ncbi:hypothetical protein COLO4_31869 [Corchorus olitorius]|uniref:DUF506 family protein n=1 Tax=Corchorus olitorius TaxID=93759 RepID=A0A1R3H3F1_9ROSI|nr:hypothetical protein COLO4_31869 [Corchorus olitorius]
MSRIRAARLNKIAVAFNEAAKAPRRLCNSSGSEHSPDDLSDLVNSFFERDCEVETDDGKIHQEEEEEQDDSDDGYWSDFEYKMKHVLQSLLSNKAHDEIEEEDVKQQIRTEAELACGVIGDMLSEDFKRQLMSHLRDKGFDAGLCKSRWEKLGSQIAGNYEYVDVNVNGSRYIVEVNLAGEFEIARPTTSYASLLEALPPIFVGKLKELKKIVKLMCKAMRVSIKNRDMHMPPWRRSGYMKSKWFGHYRRTLNELPARNPTHAGPAKRPVGFEAIPTISFHCRDNFASKAGLKVGYLAAAFNETN